MWRTLEMRKVGSWMRRERQHRWGELVCMGSLTNAGKHGQVSKVHAIKIANGQRARSHWWSSREVSDDT